MALCLQALRRERPAIWAPEPEQAGWGGGEESEEMLGRETETERERWKHSRGDRDRERGRQRWGHRGQDGDPEGGRQI